MRQWWILGLALITVTVGYGQKNFFTLTTTDYDLVGPVKSCELFTKFGSILLEFNPEGTLTNAKTSYGEKEYENISFHFVNDTLSQKNIEYFVGDSLDNAKTYYHTYNYKPLDSVQELVEYVYYFDGDLMSYYTTILDSLQREVGVRIGGPQSNASFTEILYEQKSDSLMVYKVISNDTTEQKLKVYKEDDLSLTRYLAEEITTNEFGEKKQILFEPDGSIKSELLFYRLEEDDYLLEERSDYFYIDGVVDYIEKTDSEGNKSKISYSFQFDGNDPPNWVKKIELPLLDYTTRVITYYSDNPEKTNE